MQKQCIYFQIHPVFVFDILELCLFYLGLPILKFSFWHKITYEIIHLSRNSLGQREFGMMEYNIKSSIYSSFLSTLAPSLHLCSPPSWIYKVLTFA